MKAKIETERAPGRWPLRSPQTSGVTSGRALSTKGVDMAKTYMHTGKFTGRGEFPIDMLRYDSCWPRGQDDVAVIAKTMREYQKEPVAVVVQTRTQSKVAPWTAARWASFGFTLMECSCS